MQLRRHALAALVLAGTLPALPASAAKPKPCNQISDATGDGSTLGMKSDALDVLSADISTGAKEVTAILRLKGTAVENDMALKGGANWHFNVSAGGINYSFYATWPSVVNPTPTTPPTLYGGLTAGNSPSSPLATFKREGNNFRWTVSRAAVPALKKPKQWITITSASSGANNFGGSDTAYAKPNTKYLDKTVTCLPSK